MDHDPVKTLWRLTFRRHARTPRSLVCLLQVQGGEGPRKRASPQTRGVIMKTERHWTKGVLEYCAAILLVAVGLPLIAVTALLLRGVLVFVAIGAIVVGIVLYCTHPACRRWLSQPATAAPSGGRVAPSGRAPGRD